jgi:hypothetical protein
MPVLHPNMGEVFRQKATTLAAGLEHDEERDAAHVSACSEPEQWLDLPLNT